MKVAAISSATKISEDIKKEISKLEEEREKIKEEVKKEKVKGDDDFKNKININILINRG